MELRESCLRHPITFYNKMIGFMDDRTASHSVYLDFSKASDPVSHNILTN